jgi:OOP family OmpA-OmpF porin
MPIGNQRATTVLSHRLLPGLLLAAGLAATQASHAEGLYVGGAIGTPRFGNSINGIGNGVDSSEGTGYKLYVGQNLNKTFGVEGGLFSLGTVKDATGSARTRGVFLDGVARYEFAPGWQVLGTAGLAHGRFHTSAGNDSSLALKIGAGLQYAINDRTAVRLQVDRYRFTNAFGEKPNLGQVSLGVQVGF